MTGPDDELFRDHVFYLRLFYEGPWDRLGLWLLAIDRRTNELKKEVRAGSLRDKLADACERRDMAWRHKWAARWPRKPPDRWKRKDRSGSRPAYVAGDPPE